MIKLYNGDCLKIMDELIKNGVKVDLTVTSPPYDNLRTYEDSLEWNEEIWKAVIERLYNITADGGVVVWVVGDATVKGSETGTSFKQALYFKDVGFNLHDTMIYHKNNPMPNETGNRYQPSFEYMFVLSKGKPKTFNPIKEEAKKFGKVLPKRFKGGQRKADGSKNPFHGKHSVNKMKFSHNVFNYDVAFGQASKDKIAHKHPAIFPEQLANDHIISWTNEGDTVFDPFLGSGTTGKMALLNNRNFIGIEKVEKYFNIAKERINK